MLGDIYECMQKMAVESITGCTFAKESSQGTERSTTYSILLVYQVSYLYKCSTSTAVAEFHAQVRSCGIYGGQNGTGAGFLRVFQFPLPILIPPTAPHS
jgi:hypothetical protein